MAAALSRGALQWIRRLAGRRVAWVCCQAARVLTPPPDVSEQEGVFYGPSNLLDSSWLLCSIVVRSFQSPAVQYLRETPWGPTVIPRPCAVFHGPPIRRGGIFSHSRSEDHVVASSTVKWCNEQKGAEGPPKARKDRPLIRPRYSEPITRNRHPLTPVLNPMSPGRARRTMGHKPT